MNNSEVLTTEILKLSESKYWQEAKREWVLDHIYMAEKSDPERCLCTQYPIIETCVIKNTRNNNTAIVGNSCIKKFLKNISSDTIFVTIRKIQKDDTKALNEKTVLYAYQNGWINEWEKKFSLSTEHKRKPSAKQLEHRKKINQKFLSRIKKQTTNAPL